VPNKKKKPQKVSTLPGLNSRLTKAEARLKALKDWAVAMQKWAKRRFPGGPGGDPPPTPPPPAWGA